MDRSKYGMASLRTLIVLMATVNFAAFTYAGPLGPLPMQNVTSADLGLKEGSCAYGGAVYAAGSEFSGSGPCERCRCAAGGGGVRCAPLQCDPRPGCKALHRPDHCCPTYQCECEQEGRVYGNGEKLVDPQDPCRVCYCQGGEVVCRRIACFVRDDCTPRRVPGRCCPEYDNCPLRGVTTLPGMTTSLPIIPASSSESSAISDLPKETDVVAQKFTIKEITPVSEIPIITDVKIKEILPTSNIEVAEYPSSKSPLIPREATSEKSSSTDFMNPKLEAEMPTVVEVHSSPETISSVESVTSTVNKGSDERAPSKISLSTQDSINSKIYPSDPPTLANIATMVVPLSTSNTSHVVSTTKAPMIEEEDSLLFDHNPAFPPLPDDLSVLSNSGDEIVPEPSTDSDHMPVEHVLVPESVTSVSTSTETEVKESLTTTSNYLLDISMSTSERSSEMSTEPSTIAQETKSTSPSILKEIPTIKLRSAITTEILSASSEEVKTDKGKQDEVIPTSTTLPATSTTVSSTTTEVSEKYDQSTTEEPDAPIEHVSFVTMGSDLEMKSTTLNDDKVTTTETSPSTAQDQTTNSIPKSNIATEVTSQTELSSLPIETSDQNPHDASENVSRDTLEISTTDPRADMFTTTDKSLAASSNILTVEKADGHAIENVETTEFILTSFGSSESSTDAVELIKIPGDPDKNAAIIDGAHGNKNAFTDLIKLVSDVASMSELTEAPLSVQPASSTSIPDSEELIPVNSDYKSKNSNANQNSITEFPFKSKNVTPVNKRKVVEIDEDDEAAGITDSTLPNDKVEPTTRRAIIDNVSDDMPEKKTDKKDIEIITKSYVPTINRQPTKVILKEKKPELSEERPQDNAAVSSSETATEGVTSRESSESATSSVELRPAPTGEGSNAPRGEGSSAPPGEGSSAPPGEGSSAPPGEGSSAPPGEGSTAPPAAAQ